MTTYTIDTSSTSQVINTFSSADLIKVDILNKQFSSLKFTRDGYNNLHIEFFENCVYTFTDYFSAESKINNVDMKSGAGYDSYTISSDASIFVPETSDFIGTDFNENVQLISGDITNIDDTDSAMGLTHDGYVNPKLQSTTIVMNSYANGAGGKDKIHGVVSETTVNDWINGGAGDDTIYGGTNGYDVLIGGEGKNKIVAGGFSDAETDVNIGTAENPEYVVFNSDTVEVYGGGGQDDVYVGARETYVDTKGGNDTIHVYGENNNSLIFTGDFGDDAVYFNDSTTNTVLKFAHSIEEVPSGYKLSQLSFSGSFPAAEGKNDLVISVGDNSVTVKDFYTVDSEGEKENNIGLSAIDESGKIINVIYNTDGKLHISDKSDYLGTSHSEVITMASDTTSNIKKDSDHSDLPENYDEKTGKYTSNITKDGVHIDAYTNGAAGNDEIYGTSNNDWINGGADNDTIYGGVNGIDMLIGGDGNDIIVAGALDENGAVVLDEDTNWRVTLNPSSSEIYGGSGNDKIYAGGNNRNLIQAGSGADEIHLYGGSNTLVFTDEFGGDTILGAQSNDILKFSDGTNGHKFSDLLFQQSENDLTITDKLNVSNILTIKDYFNDSESRVDNIIALDSGGQSVQYSILADAVFEVSDVSDYVGFSYNEKITLKTNTTGNIPKDDAHDDLPQGYNAETGEYYSAAAKQNVHIDAYASGKEGNDKIYGTDGNDWLNSGSGDDAIYGGSDGVDMLIGGDGNDIIVAGRLNGDDSITYNTSGAKIDGGNNDDKIYAGGDDTTINIIDAGYGNDEIHLHGGNNTLSFNYNFGSDEVTGLTGKDLVTFSGKFTNLTFDRSDDDLVINETGDDETGSVQLKDFFSNTNTFDKIRALNDDEALPTYEEYSILNDATIKVTTSGSYEGTKYNEEITMSNAGTVNVNYGNNIVYGSSGNDLINGANGDDVIYGGQGNNELSGEAGEDIIIAGTLSDTGTEITYKKDGAEQNVKVQFNSSGDIIKGGAGNDQLFVGSSSYVYSELGDDEISSYGSGNVFYFTEDNFGKDIILASDSTDSIHFSTDGTDGYSIAEIRDISQVVHADGSSDVIIVVQHAGKPENRITIKNYDSSSVNDFYTKGIENPWHLQDYIPVERNYDTNVKNVIKGTEKEDLIVADHTRWAGKSKTIYGYANDDIIIAGKGNDKLYGGSGYNTFNFYVGDGKDTIYANDGTTVLGNDTLNIYGVEKDLENVSLSVKGNDLIVTYSSKDSITIKDYYKQDSSGKYTRSVNKISFFSGVAGNWTEVKTIDNLADYVVNAENTIVDIEELGKSTYKGSIISETIVGDENNNTLKGGGGNDVIYASAGTNKIYTESRAGDTATVYAGYGKDTINAGKGIDTYVFEDGHCGDTIVANSTGTVVLDISKLSDFSFTEKGNNLIINNTYALDKTKGIYATETVTIKDYLKNKLTNNIFIGTIDEDNRLDRYLKREQAKNLSTVVVGNPNTSKNQSVTGSFLDETLSGGKGNDTIKSNGGIDILSGGKGNDKLYGYIAKDGKTPVYDDESNAKTYGFTYGYDSNGYATIIEGDGKDTIYNSKKSDSIGFIVNGKDKIVDAVKSFVNDIKIEKGKSDLVITYTDIKDSKNKAVDTITISGYNKLDSTNAMQKINILDGDGTFIYEVNLLSDFGDDGTLNAGVKDNIINVITGQNILFDGDINESFVNTQNGFDTYLFGKSAGYKTEVTDSFGSDVYICTDMKQSVCINDTAGKDTLNISDVENAVKVFFNVAKTEYTSDIEYQNSLFLFDTNISATTTSVRIDNWFDDSVKEDMTVYAEDDKLSFRNLDSLRSEVVSWLDGTGYDTAYEALQNAGSDPSVQNMIDIYAAYNPY